MAAGGTHDVIVVGARCAGSALATHLTRAGLSVAVLDRSAFPSDVVSSHVFQRGAIECLDRLGALDRVRALGAPRVRMAMARMDDGVDLTAAVEADEDDELETMMCVRRISLDPILVDTAREAGAEVRTSTKVRGLLREGGRVAGVEAEDADGRAFQLRAPLVVGADGMSSTVASQVGARRYNLIHNGRFYQYAYYEGVRLPDPVSIIFHRKRYELGFACPTDGGRTIVTLGAHFGDLDEWRKDMGRGFDAEVAKMDDIADLLSGARRVTEPRGLIKCTSYFRQSAGPGWVLVGDAGHFKDPTPGQGMTDALKQAERVSREIVAGWGESQARLDRRLRGYWKWRDQACYERHWWASDLALPGRVSPISLEVLRRLSQSPGGARRFWEMFLQARSPREVLRPSTAAAATAALLWRRSIDASEVVADSRRLTGAELGRLWKRVRPEFEAA